MTFHTREPRHNEPICHDFHVDPLGFPMLWIEEIQAYLHWFPVTKIQFECFLCDALDGHFDGAWYSRLLQQNPRVTPEALTSSNYWRAFLTGVTHDEARRFARWCGDGFRLPTEVEWAHTFAVLKSRRFSEFPLVEQLFDVTRQRRRVLIERLGSAAMAVCEELRQPLALSSMMLMEMGVLEWVERSRLTDSWVARGAPHPNFFGNLHDPRQSVQPLPDGSHQPFGFRLLFTPDPNADPPRSMASGDSW